MTADRILQKCTSALSGGSPDVTAFTDQTKIIEARKPQTSVQRLLTISGRKPHIIHRCGDGKTISVSDIGPVDLLGWIKPGPSHAFAFVDPRQRFVRLRELGIQIIDTAGLPFSDQVRMFAGMKAIIGLHGAGLANMTWMPAGGYAVEITPPPNGSTCFRELAKMLGHHYIQIGTLASHSEIGDDSESFTIDPAGFRHAMAAVLSQLRIQ
jgi:hypothetical protein